MTRPVFSQPARLWSGYLNHLNRRPILTKTLTSAVAALLGDALAQHTARKSRALKEWRYDWARTARMMAFQGLLLGPFGHFYYQLLDRSVMPAAAKSPAAVATKIVIDQLVFAPIATAFFFAYNCLTEGRPRALRRELGEKYKATMVANWKLWPAAHLINFAFVPSSQRILYANVVSVLGVYILSKAAAGELVGPKLRVRQQSQLLAMAPQQGKQAQRGPVATITARLPSKQLQQQEEGEAHHIK